MAGGKGAPEADGRERDIAVAFGAIVAYERGKKISNISSNDATSDVAGVSSWKEYGKRRQMRGGLL